MENNQFQLLNHRFLIGIVLAILAIFLIVASASGFAGFLNKLKEGRYISQEIESKNTITVSDTAEIYAKPDLAVVVFTVRTEGSSVSRIMAENNQKINAVTEEMKKQNIGEKDLKTTSFNISPIYNFPDNRRVLQGYEVSQSLEVKIRDLAKAGETIQKATEAGANQAGDLVFTIDQPEDLKDQVRQDAIAKAKDKAKIIADQLGVSLVRIVNFGETSQSPYYSYPRYEAVGMGGGGAAPDIQTGENKVEVNVSITYEID